MSYKLRIDPAIFQLPGFNVISFALRLLRYKRMKGKERVNKTRSSAKTEHAG
jgi:hypothetical protein